MAISDSPVCPRCGAWNVRVSYTAPEAAGAEAREQLAGRCNSCNHEWTGEL